MNLNEIVLEIKRIKIFLIHIYLTGWKNQEMMIIITHQWQPLSLIKMWESLMI